MKVLLILVALTSATFSNANAQVSKAKFEKLQTIVLKNQKLLQKLVPVGNTVDEMRRYFDSKNISFEIEDELSEEELAESFAIVKSCIYEVEKNHPPLPPYVLMEVYWYWY